MVVNPTRSANRTLTTRRSVGVAEARGVCRAPDVGAGGAASSATRRVPQVLQKIAPGTMGDPHVGQPIRFPQRRQNFASGRFSVAQLAQITLRDCTAAPYHGKS